MKRTLLKFILPVLLILPIMTTDEVAERLAEMSSLTKGDVYNVLLNLPLVMRQALTEGRSVKLEGLGSFWYTADCKPGGEQTRDECGIHQIKRVHGHRRRCRLDT